MATQRDSIEKILADMTAIIHRAIDLGDRRAVERVRKVLGSQLDAQAASATPTGAPVTPPPASISPGVQESRTLLKPKTPLNAPSSGPISTVGSGNDQSYGVNADLIRRAVRDAAGSGGIHPSSIPQYCMQHYGATITDKQVRNSARNLRRTHSIRYSRGKWLPGAGMSMYLRTEQ
jgi:hypothetical protein